MLDSGDPTRSFYVNEETYLWGLLTAVRNPSGARPSLVVPRHFKGFNREGLCELGTHGIWEFCSWTYTRDINVTQDAYNEIYLAASEQSQSIEQLLMSTS